jgi:Spy/CpxP family protein refolding chaperone
MDVATARNDELWDRAQTTTIAAHGAQDQVVDAWSEFRSLSRSLIEARRQVHDALRKGHSDVEAHEHYQALVSEIEAQIHVMQQARVDLEKAETARRAAFDQALDYADA